MHFCEIELGHEPKVLAVNLRPHNTRGQVRPAANARTPEILHFSCSSNRGDKDGAEDLRLEFGLKLEQPALASAWLNESGVRLGSGGIGFGLWSNLRRKLMTISPGNLFTAFQITARANC
jgi:hypothetical protein